MKPSNPAKGLSFRDAARPILERHLGVQLTVEVPLPIGNPAKQHKFDLVACDMSWVIECKALTWRANGQVPQAKITSITEAAMCLRDCAQTGSERAIVLDRATHPRQNETLATYYARLHRHALAQVVSLIEIDSATGTLSWLVRRGIE